MTGQSIKAILTVPTKLKKKQKPDNAIKKERTRERKRKTIAESRPTLQRF